MTQRPFLIYFMIPACLFLSGCDPMGKKPPATTGTEPVDGYRNPAFEVYPDPSGKAYFPLGKESYYTWYLASMKEPSIQGDLPKGATFVMRFTLLPSFTDNLMVRIYDRDGAVYARAARQKKDRNYNPLETVDDRIISLGGKLPEPIKSLLTDNKFWTPLNEEEEAVAGLDGAIWIFELRNAAGYHMLDPWCPDAERASDETLRNAGFDPGRIRDFLPYAKAGDDLLKLAKLQKELLPE